MKSNFNMEKIKNIIGLFLVVLGALFNEWVLGKFFSVYAIIELNNRVRIWILEVVLIGLGLTILLLKIDIETLKKLKKFYKTSSIIFVSTLLIFIFVNFVCYAAFIIKDVIVYKNQIVSKYGKTPEPLYPTLTSKQINQLLKETWTRPYVFEAYTQFKERPYHGKFVNVSENGFRFVKNQGPWPPDKNNFNIFLFGGSTTFNYGVSDDQTIASYLQMYLSNFVKSPELSKRNSHPPAPSSEVYVYNFGRGNYFSTQERLLFEKLLTEGFIPDLAIFIDGLNEFYYLKDEPLFTDRFTQFVEGERTMLPRLSLLLAVSAFKKYLTERNSSTYVTEEKYNDLLLISKVIDRYLKNKQLIEASSKAFGVKTAFIWQPIPTYKYDLKYDMFADVGFGRFTYCKYGYPRMFELFKSNELGNNFLWLADIQENIKKPLYVDAHHYSPEISQIIAKSIGIFLVNRGLLSYNA